MRPNPQETADSVTFTDETINGKLHFLCSVSSTHNTPVLQGLFPELGFLNVLRKSLPDF